MPIRTISLPPDGEALELLYTSRHPEDVASYFNALRSGVGVEAFRPVAEAMIPIHGPRIARTVCDWPTPFQAMISPPSSRGDAKMLRDEIRKICSIPDLSGCFTRKDEIRAAYSGTVDDLVQEFVYKTSGVEAGLQNILIVDELVATGKTVAAVLRHLRMNGLPTGCKIVVAAYGWIPQRTAPVEVTPEA